MERPKEFDVVEKPKHYNSHPSGLEAIDLCEHLSFNTGNAVKYIWRAGLKNDEAEDLKKALWYIKRERALIKLYEQEPPLPRMDLENTLLAIRVLIRKIVAAEPEHGLLGTVLAASDISLWEHIVEQEITVRHARAKDHAEGR